jgi:hypothetical protein
MVCDIWLTNVTRRREPAAPEGGGSGAAGAEGGPEADDAAEGSRARVGAAEDPVGEAAPVAAGRLAAAAFAAAGVADEPATADAAAVVGRWPTAVTAPPAPFEPKAAQPAVRVMTPSSTAAVVSAPDRRARRLPFRPNITRVLPAWIRFRTGDARRRRQITHFGLRIFRYRGAGVVSPSL